MGQDWFVVGHDGTLHSGLRLLEWLFTTPVMMILFKQMHRHAVLPLDNPDSFKFIKAVMRTKPAHAGGGGAGKAGGKVGSGGGDGGGGGGLGEGEKRVYAPPAAGSSIPSFSFSLSLSFRRLLFIHTPHLRRAA